MKLRYVLPLLPLSVQANSELETASDVVHLALPLSALAATIWYEEGYDGTWQLAKAAVSSRVVVEGLKWAVDKPRPDNSGNDSFPSGHTNDAFMAATFIQKRYGSSWGIPAYLGAGFVAWSRVETDKHYVEDVLAGAAIGSLASWYFTTRYEPGDLVLLPDLRDQYAGVNLYWQF